ncbi:spore germination protein PE [Bacillus niacini]|jgi:spore germination protein PE|uniref:Spore germination protein PE n=1 Tax=Neobacillus niacini TaxID=86668 RepID=A0A852TCU6_9BACI|nr:spore germination protein GerPE [Neobacillus niacini]NYE05547.1 spore germination protein PE [Neobacillus niacini]
MLERTSVVNTVKVNSASFASTIQLGDSRTINGFSRALAVQREADVFYGKEGNFSNYLVFSEPIPLLPITEKITISTHNKLPVIKVNTISIIAMSSAAILHVGNSENISLEARVKHIRQLLNAEEEQ